MTTVEMYIRLAVQQLARTWRVAHAAIGVARRHAPRWLVIVLAVALAIPGPVDELIVLVIIAGLLVFKPKMRVDLRESAREAWGR